MIIRQQPTASVLSNIYDICNRLFGDDNNCFYTEDEIEEKKQNSNNIFLEAEYETKNS